MRFGKFFLVEIVQMRGEELVAHAAQVVSAPPRRTSSGSSSPAGQADEAAFLAGIADHSYRDAINDVIAGCTALGVEVKWRSQGASFRITTPDRRQPLSIGWILPDDSHWQGARFATFGVDPWSLSKTPSVKGAVEHYTNRLAAIAGAKPVASKLDAFTFGIDTLPNAHAAIVAAIGNLVREIGEANTVVN
ncbi:hypothetical protein [Agromyces bauzanensis]|nr:hypothetical protein [Agromyces bauzanensis]